MRRYIQHLKDNRTPHERRTHALQVAGGITALLFVVWLGSLGWRFSTPAEVAESGSDNQTTLPQQALTASAAAAQQTNEAHLEVSTTSVYQ